MAILRVMVVDDNAIFCNALCTLLNHIAGLQCVATAQDGAEALPLIAEKQPHLLLLDINMPQMNGWELLDHLRQIHNPIDVIVLTAYPDGYFKQFALDRGANAYVTKGNIEHLLDTIQTFMPESKAP